MGNIMAALAYLFGWLSGLIVFFISKDDKVARFHGMQAILFNIASIIVMVIVVIIAVIIGIVIAMIGAATNIGILALVGTFITPVILLGFGLIVFLLMLWTMWQAFNDKMYKLPIVGGMAENWSK